MISSGPATSGQFRFPPQNLTIAQKKQQYGGEYEWGVATIKAIDQIVLNRGGMYSTIPYYTKNIMTENINLVRHGVFNIENFKRLLEPYGSNVSLEFPVELEHFPIINKKIELLRGEEISRPFNISVINSTDDALNTFQEERASMIYQLLQETFVAIYKSRQNLEANDTDVLAAIQQQFEKKLKEIEKYAEVSYSDHLESVANSLLKYFIHSQDLTTLFNRNFFNYLCTGSEIYCVEILDNEPHVRIVDPRYFDYDSPSFEDFIDNSAWCRELEYITAAEIYERYYDYLTDDDVELIEATKNYTYNSLDLGYSGGEFIEHGAGTNTSLIRVGHYEWKSLKKVRVLTTYDENGIEYKEILDPKYKKQPDDIIEVKWISERWEGIRIGLDVFIKVQPIPDQYTSLENLSKSQSRYIGLKAGFSMVDKLKKYQYLYNVTMFQLKLMMSRNKGRGFVIDMAQIPKTSGWTIEKWLFYLDQFGISVINSAELDANGDRSTFNQFSSIDRSTGDQIQFLVAQLEFIKNEMSEISGITNQREGNISASETYGGIERSVTQSSAITESLFWLHTQAKKKVLQRLLDIAKSCYKPGKKLSFILGNKARTVLEIPEDFSLGEFGVYVADSGDEAKMITELLQLAQVALQQKEITLDKYIEARSTKSIAAMSAIFKEAAAETNERANQQNVANQQQLQQQAELNKQAIDQEYAKKMEIEKLKSETSIEVAKIAAESRVLSFRTDLDADINDNGIADVVELDKLKLERERLDRETALKSRELDIKEKDIEGKKS